MALTTVKKNGKTSYTINFYYKDSFGKRKRVKKENFTTKKAANNFKKDFLEKYAGNCSSLFKNIVDVYLEHIRARKKLTSYHTIKTVFEFRLVPVFGELPINKITPAIISRWQDKISKGGLSPASQRLTNTCLSMFFNYCVKLHGLKQNPAKICGTIGKATNSISYWQVEEFNKFIKLVKKPERRMVYYILFYGGLRIGEVLALTVEDFNPDTGTLTINKTLSGYVKGKGAILGTPKTPTSNRIVTLPPKVAVMLSDYISKMYNPKPKERIFFSVIYGTIICAFKNTIKKAGLKPITIHDLRHSHASMLINLGVSPLAISQRLGHKNVATTLNIYSHLYPSTAQKLVNDLDKFVI